MSRFHSFSKRRTVALPFLLVLLLTTGCGLNHASSRLAFMGDSITMGWSFPRVNFGIHGQTTAEMLARFPNQVLHHGYRGVVILGGTNDVLLNISPDVTIANLARMIDLAQADGIEPTLCEIPPIFRTDQPYQARVTELNRRIIGLATAKRIKLVDYYDPIRDHPGYSSDGVHFKRRGYLVMERALLKVESPF